MKDGEDKVSLAPVTAARWDGVSHRYPTIQVRMECHDAFAVGTVLEAAFAAMEKEGGADVVGRRARIREVAERCLGVCLDEMPVHAEDVARALEAHADTRTETGKRALVVAGSIRAAIERCRANSATAVRGLWVPARKSEPRMDTDGHESERVAE